MGELTTHSKGDEGANAIINMVPKDSSESIEGGAEDFAGRASEKAKAEAAEPIKVLLVDDHQLVREGLRSIIEREEDMIVIAEAKNGVEAVHLAAEIEPHVIVMDVNMPEMNGIAATKKIMDGKPKLRIIGLSIHDKENVEDSLLKAGASVYLTKDDAMATLCTAIRSQYEALK